MNLFLFWRMVLLSVLYDVHPPKNENDKLTLCYRVSIYKTGDPPFCTLCRISYHCFRENVVVQLLPDESWTADDNTLYNVEIDMTQDRLIDLLKESLQTLL